MQSPSTLSAQSTTTAPISLLRLIAEDETFRAKLENDPVAAFAEHGIDIDFDGKPALEASAIDSLRDWLESNLDEDKEKVGPFWRGIL